ncbi:PAS domain-containing protein [Pseudanabaena sp. FACHB-1998]|uniref:PAS domain-containing sensor histidine kinase n=1 Tax=Pseudanabaena sp. FACHB-1998 TaxID=2692858 RepID=UPI0016815FBB|nr:PAS domain-containing sensor histidine kinase [Pseudanabaena sp. FACHB-1998]MBD2178958.1 PAS domain-containing protein [Pseudanabaena sp. FACHB-1998]
MSHEYVPSRDNLLAEIIDSFDDIVWSLALPDLTPLYFNAAAAKIYQCDREELLANPHFWLEAIALDDQPKMQEAIAQAQIAGSSRLNYQFQQPNGTKCWFSVRWKIFKDNSGLPVHLDAIATEISDRYQVASKQQQTVEIILQGESRYYDVIQRQTDLILRSLADTTIIFANEALCNMLGSPLEQVLGQKWIDFAEPDDLQSVLQNIALLSPIKSSFIAVNRDRRTDGQIGWTQWINQGIFNECGKLVEIQSVGRDITELKQSELSLQQLNLELEKRIKQSSDDLRQSEARNLAILHTLPDLLLLLKPDGTCLQCIMPSSQTKSKYLPIQHHISEVLDPEDLQAQLKIYATAIATGEVQIYEHQLTKFGKTVYEEVRIAPYCEDELLVIVRDITDRKKTEQQLQNVTDRLTLALKSASIGIWEWNIANNFLIWDERTYELYGVNPVHEPDAYLAWASRVHPSDRQFAENEVQLALSGTKDYEPEFRILLPDGSIRYIKAYALVQRNDEGLPQRMLGINFDITNSKLAEAQLMKTDTHLKTAQRIGKLGSWEFEISTGILTWSDEVFRIYGLEPSAEPPGYEELQQYIHPDDWEYFHHTVQTAINSQKAYDLEHRIIQSNGKLIYVLAKGEMIYNGSGQLTHIVGTAIDITDRKIAEQKLQNLTDRLTLALKSAAIGIWEWDVPNDILIWDERMYELYEVDSHPSPITYLTWANRLHPSDRATTEASVQLAFQGAKDFDIEFRILLPDDTIRYIKAYALIQKNKEGNPDRMIGINFDITARKLAEAELKRSHDLREAIFNESTDALFLVDPYTLLTTDCNLPAVHLFEASDKSELIGIEGRILQERQFSLAELEQINLEMATKGFWSQEVTYISLKGHCFWGNLAVRQIIVAGQTTNLVRVTDISAQKRSEAKILQTSRQLENTNRELESFCYSVSHDLRAPLRHINGFVNALQQQLKRQELLSDPKIMHYLQVIDSSSQKMGSLIDGLLILSRFGRKPLDFHQISVRELVDEAIEIICTDPAHNPALEFAIGELPNLVGDATLLHQVFRNLIDNAVKFSRNQPKPVIEIDSLPDGTIRIKDNGAGFQMEYADKLFGAFQRLHNEKEFEGTGIGLAIVQRIIQRHGGSIWAESSPNQGATFFVKL